MPEIKRIFDEKYGSCDIEQIPDYDLDEYRLGSISKPVVYSVDCLFRQQREQRGSRCDEFVFFELDHSKTGIYLIERKTNSQNVKKVMNQLKGGARFIENFLDNDPATENQPLNFMPVCVSKGLRSSAHSKLIKVKISLRNSHKRIKHIHKNSTLPKLK